MLKKIGLSFALFCLWAAVLFAAIIETPNLDLFEKELAKAGEQTLVLFDVDDTLLSPTDAIFCLANRRLIHHYMHTVLQNPAIVPPGIDESDYLISKILMQRKVKLVDSRAPLLIRTLQQKGIKTLALTAISTGKFGLIKSLEVKLFF